MTYIVGLLKKERAFTVYAPGSKAHLKESIKVCQKRFFLIKYVIQCLSLIKHTATNKLPTDLGR